MLFEEQTIGPYVVLDILGEGGFGRVYRAVHRDLGREVALKTLLPGASMARDDLLRFEREARMLAKLSHPNVVRIYDTGRDGDIVWLAMELIRGESFRSILEKDRRLPIGQALAAVRDVAMGLSAIHALGVVHRDIKPDNMMLSVDGLVKLMDFGLAKDPRATSITVADSILGTPIFAAPEMLLRKTLDHRLDIYQLGMVLYMCVCGELPWSSPTIQDYLISVIGEPPTPPSTHNPSIGPRLEALLLSALAKDAADRPANADAFAREAQALIDVPDTIGPGAGAAADALSGGLPVASVSLAGAYLSRASIAAAAAKRADATGPGKGQPVREAGPHARRASGTPSAPGRAPAGSPDASGARRAGRGPLARAAGPVVAGLPAGARDSGIAAGGLTAGATADAGTAAPSGALPRPAVLAGVGAVSAGLLGVGLAALVRLFAGSASQDHTPVHLPPPSGARTFLARVDPADALADARTAWQGEPTDDRLEDYLGALERRAISVSSPLAPAQRVALLDEGLTALDTVGASGPLVERWDQRLAEPFVEQAMTLYEQTGDERYRQRIAAVVERHRARLATWLEAQAASRPRWASTLGLSGRPRSAGAPSQAPSGH